MRGADGRFTHVPALLDTPVQLERRVRGTNDALEALLEALHVATGATVLSGGLFLNGEQVTEAGGVGVPARDVLAEILDAQTADDPPDNGIWRLVWDSAEQRWVLSVRFVRGLGKHWGPPPARPVPAEPPHRP